jgi:hypothetical protein
MNSRLSRRTAQIPHKTRDIGQRISLLCLFAMVACMLVPTLGAMAADAPGWMHALVNAPVPAYSNRTDAVRLFSEEILSVQPNGKIKHLRREVYKILRPGGQEYGMLRVPYDSESRITGIHAWCIPAEGKDYEVRDKEAIETALYGVENSELVTDLRTKILQIPAADPGNIVGYEIEQEDRPYILQDAWIFQRTVPTREARYTLQLPTGWEYKVMWVNHPEAIPTAMGNNQWQWVIKDVKAIEREDEMPPWQSVAGQMLVSLLPVGGGGQKKGFVSWSEMGAWYLELAGGRRDPSPDLKQKVSDLTASLPTPLEKMQALAHFVQQDIRYVAIELGIGGLQPRPAAEVFTKRYGDCKDKATLMSSMLKEIGVDSYYVVINTDRGAVTPETPPHIGGFNHLILAIQLSENVSDPSLVAVMQHPKLKKILFFDPTDDLTPFGRLRGALQANYGMLVTPEGGELTELPLLPVATNEINRTAKLKLDENGTLQGDFQEILLGDPAANQRYALRATKKDADKIKPIETLLAHSLATFQVTKASVTSLERTDLPFKYDYSIVSRNYAKLAGNLLLVRPRVLGIKSSGLLETMEPRQYPVEFEGPERDTDSFEIALPVGYEVEDLPPPVDAEYSFASYHSKAEVNGGVLRYARTLEVKEISVPLGKVEELKMLYRLIANDERNTAVLRATAH